jgi:hypothetical protein
VYLDGLPLADWLAYPLPLDSMDATRLPVTALPAAATSSSVSYGAVPASAAGWSPGEQWDSAAREWLHASTPSGLGGVQAGLEERHAAGEKTPGRQETKHGNKRLHKFDNEGNGSWLFGCQASNTGIAIRHQERERRTKCFLGLLSRR